MEEESDEYFTIYRFHLAPTHDFKKEIMSWGASVEIICPEDFRQEIKEEINAMQEYYDKWYLWDWFYCDSNKMVKALLFKNAIFA